MARFSPSSRNVPAAQRKTLTLPGSWRTDWKDSRGVVVNRHVAIWQSTLWVTMATISP
jgi:hypothetical protein